MKRIPIGSGCKTCPVNPCETLTYRGSTCAAQRAKHGLGDPLTHADQIRAMSDEELCEFLMCDVVCDQKTSPDCEDCEKCVMDWLQQPAES